MKKKVRASEIKTLRGSKSKIKTKSRTVLASPDRSKKSRSIQKGKKARESKKVMKKPPTGYRTRNRSRKLSSRHASSMKNVQGNLKGVHSYTNSSTTLVGPSPSQGKITVERLRKKFGLEPKPKIS